MAVTAFLVLGSDGSSTFRGSSAEISTDADRKRFLTMRRKSDVILIGGNTARSERYARTPVPLIILSRSRPDVLDQNPLATWWKLAPEAAVKRAIQEFGPAVSIEGGINFIGELLQAGAISQLELSLTPRFGGDATIDFLTLLSHFGKVEKSQIQDTIFYSCTEPITRQK